MKKSIWHPDANPGAFEQLEGEIRTDVLIIGGGLAGILCAHRLAQQRTDYVLIESDRILRGISGNTTAKITSQHGLIYDKLIREFGEEAARGYYEANEAALEAYRSLGREYACDFEQKDNFIYSTGDTRKLEREMRALERLKIPARYVRSLPLPFPVAGAVCFPNQAQFHPLKLAGEMTKSLRIYENTRALAFRDNLVLTDRGSIRAEKIIVATHFPILNKHGAFFLKMYQKRSYVIAYKNAGQVEGMYLDAADNGLSFRNWGDTLLIGGGGHRTGKQGRGWHVIEEFARTHYPRAREVCRWAAQDCMTLDSVPYIGQYSPATPNLYVATGFQKWGMTSSMVSAMVLTDLIRGKENPYARVFDPSRTILRPQLFVNAWESTVNLLTPTRPRCPHLGCALKWNPMEHSWDCPCHGSRFGKDGTLADGPANDDLNRKYE